MDMDSGVGTDYGSGGGLGGKRQREGNWDNCNAINNKTFFKKVN